jgi:hypothetical protein
MIEYRFRVTSATIFTLYSYSKYLEYRFRLLNLTPGRGGFDHRVWWWAAEIKESYPLKYVLNLLVSSESAPRVLSGTASRYLCPSDDGESL